MPGSPRQAREHEGTFASPNPTSPAAGWGPQSGPDMCGSARLARQSFPVLLLPPSPLAPPARERSRIRAQQPHNHRAGRSDGRARACGVPHSAAARARLCALQRLRGADEREARGWTWSAFSGPEPASAGAETGSAASVFMSASARSHTSTERPVSGGRELEGAKAASFGARGNQRAAEAGQPEPRGNTVDATCVSPLRSRAGARGQTRSLQAPQNAPSAIVEARCIAIINLKTVRAICGSHGKGKRRVIKL